MSRLILSCPIVAFVFFVERYLCSILFLFLAWEHFSILRLLWLIARVQATAPGALLAHDGNFRNGVTFDDFARYILLTISFGTRGVLLLFSRRLKHGPNTATFSSLAFDPHVRLPASAVTAVVLELVAFRPLRRRHAPPLT